MSSDDYVDYEVLDRYAGQLASAQGHTFDSEAWRRDLERIRAALLEMAEIVTDHARQIIDAFQRLAADLELDIEPEHPVERARSAKERAAAARERGLHHHGPRAPRRLR